MRIAINLLNFRPGLIGGTETYIRELAAHLPEFAGRDEIVLLVNRDIAAEFDHIDAELAVVDLSSRMIAGLRFIEATSSFRARAVERVLDRLAPCVMLFPQQAMFPKQVACATALVVHDLYHVCLPENLSRWQRMYRRSIYGWSVRNADRLITVSDYTRRSLIEHYGLHDRADRIHTVHHGFRASTGDDCDSCAGSANDRPYVYYPAVTHPHKNHLQLFEAAAQLRNRNEFPFRIVLSGSRTPHWQTLKAHIRRLGLRDVVSHAGFLPYAQVRGLYRGASAVVFPSSYEGFGIPVLEAAALGKKLITSDIEAFRELGVPEQFRIDFEDPRALARALSSEAPVTLERPIQTWRETARQTLDILRQTAAERPTLAFETAIGDRRVPVLAGARAA